MECFDHCSGGEALKLFQRMQDEAMTPNSFTLLEDFSAWANQVALATSKKMQSCIVHDPMHTDNGVGSTLSSMYGNFTQLEEQHMECIDCNLCTVGVCS